MKSTLFMILAVIYILLSSRTGLRVHFCESAFQEVAVSGSNKGFCKHCQTHCLPPCCRAKLAQQIHLSDTHVESPCCDYSDVLCGIDCSSIPAFVVSECNFGFFSECFSWSPRVDIQSNFTLVFQEYPPPKITLRYKIIQEPILYA